MSEISEMIERGAKALFDLEQSNPFQVFTNKILYGKEDGITWEYISSSEVVSSIADGFREKSRIVMEAMREPTPAMIEAWSEPSNLDDYTDETCARADWQAMLDAALK